MVLQDQNQQEEALSFAPTDPTPEIESPKAPMDEDKLWLSHNKKGIWNNKEICNVCGATLNDEQQCTDCIENDDVEMIQ